MGATLFGILIFVNITCYNCLVVDFETVRGNEKNAHYFSRVIPKTIYMAQNV